MKKVILAISLISVFLLTGCNKDENIENNNLPNNTVIEIPNNQSQNTPTSGDLEDSDDTEKDEDTRLFEDFVSKVKVIENRKDFYDESGELLYYIQHDYLESCTDEENINKIVANYPKEEISEQTEFDEITRYYPEDVYYDVSSYVISNVHNGILNIKQGNDWWWGSPHPYPSSSCKNYVLATGEEYFLPEEIKDDIYAKAVDKFLEIAKENNYEGLLGNYFDNNETLITYLNYNEETQEKTLVNEDAFRQHVLEAISSGYFELTDDLIFFYLNAAYDLSDWASRTSYSTIEIPNEWDI